MDIINLFYDVLRLATAAIAFVDYVITFVRNM